jgi:hypothetical protein
MHHAAAPYRLPAFLPYLLLVATSAVVLGGAVAQDRVPPVALFADPLAAAASVEVCCKPYLGAVSAAGVLLWAASAAVCAFTALVLACSGRVGRAGLPLAAGTLTGLLAVDDLWMVHERLLPAQGVPEQAVLAFIVGCGALYLLAFRRRLLSFRWPMLAVACGAFAVSIGADALSSLPPSLHVLTEDGSKFVGIVAWFLFHVEAMLTLSVGARDPVSGPVR